MLNVMNVARLHCRESTGPRNPTWFIRPFLLMRGWRGWGLGTRLSGLRISRERKKIADYTKHILWYYIVVCGICGQASFGNFCEE